MDDTASVTAAPPNSMSRRRLLFGSVAAAAAVGGATLAWRRYAPDEIGPAAIHRFWNTSFHTPQGAPLVMSAFRGKPLVINFWATWCPPCVDELPLLDAFYRKNASNSWQVVGLAIDQPSAVRAFLARKPVSFPVGLAGLDGTELSKALGNSSGGLPFSVQVSGPGEVMHRKIGRLTDADLASWVRLS